MANDPTVRVHVSAPSGQSVELAEGDRLVFGRGAGVDLPVSADLALSRRAGLVAVVTGGAWVGNLSHTHSLYAESGGFRVRLPRLEEGLPEPVAGWFVRSGEVLVGSRAMLADGLAVVMRVTAESTPGEQATGVGESTVLPLVFDPHTKVFLVTLLWCRPWLTAPPGTVAVPRVPEIARAALEVTGAHYELGRFDREPAFRELMSGRVAEHLKVIRRRISDRGLVPAGTRLSDEVVVQALIEHSVITPDDLRRLDDPQWRSRQEDLWWD